MKGVYNILLLRYQYLITAKYTVISPDLLVWKFCGKTQFLHSFGWIAQNYAETVPFHNISTPENQVKWRYFSQFEDLIVVWELIEIVAFFRIIFPSHWWNCLFEIFFLLEISIKGSATAGLNVCLFYLKLFIKVFSWLKNMIRV